MRAVTTFLSRRSVSIREPSFRVTGRPGDHLFAASPMTCLRLTLAGLAVSLCLASRSLADEAQYGEKGGLDFARKALRQGRFGVAERLLTPLNSAQAKATRAALIAKDETRFRRRGLTAFDPQLANRLA